MKPDIKCRRCGYVVYGKETQIIYDAQKKRHVLGRHTEHQVISERDGKAIHGHGMGNLDIGKVVWDTVW